MCPTCNYEHNYCARGGGNDDRADFCLDDVKVEHERHARWYEEESHVFYKEVGDGLHPFQFYYLYF